MRFFKKWSELKSVFMINIELGSLQWRIQDLPKGWGRGGRTMASARSTSLNGGQGGETPPEAESFLYIFIQKVTKS